MLDKRTALVLLFLSTHLQAQDSPATISQEAAQAIALSVAGCKESDHCIINGKFSDGAWLFTVLRLAAPNADGGSSSAHGQFVAVKLDPQGHLLKRIPEK